VCLSGLAALKYGYLNVKSGEAENVVATGSEVFSTALQARNFDRETEFLEKELKQNPSIAFEKDFLRWMLSDGAGAVLLQNHPNENGLSLKINWIDSYSFSNKMETCMYAGSKKVDGKLLGYREFSSDD
jgi:3-oxoacyl-[acyl-carrier-protein] synthase-3